MTNQFKYLTVKQLIEIHAIIVEKFGKEKGVMDTGNLESALLRVESYKGSGEDALFWKAAILIERIVLSHPFIDGNKRAGFEACKTFLEMNGYFLKSNEDETIELLVRIAKGKANRYSIKNWLEKHSKKRL